MARLHGIVNTAPLVQKKVNFFADYFSYMVEYMGEEEGLSLDNPLSIIEKVIFQLETNLTNSVQYLENYFSNPFLLNTKLMSEYSHYPNVLALINAFQSQPIKKKLVWLQQNKTTFLSNAKSLQRQLSENMFKKSLDAAISYLTCPHDIDFHIQDFRTHTQIIVSELFFSGRNRKDLGKTFEKIITKDIKEFPFPKHIKSNRDKAKFMANRSLKEQFEGIYNLLDHDREKNTFLFRIFGLKTEDTFKFKYNHVTFVSSNDTRFDNFKNASRTNLFANSFFSPKDFIIAYVKVQFTISELGRKDALNIIREEMKFLRSATESNLTLDPYSYLATRNFKNFGGSFGSKTKGVFIDKEKIRIINDNPFKFLRKYQGECVERFLKCESLFVAANESGKTSDYWHYLEVLIPKSEDDKKRIKSVLSHAILLNYISLHERHLKEHLYYYVFDIFSNNHESLGITEEQKKYYSQYKNINLTKLSTVISHPFIKHLLSDWKNKRKEIDYDSLQKYYYSILTEAYEIRNGYIHEGINNEKSVLKIYYSLPRLIVRFRWVIFAEIRKQKWNNFDDLINSIEEQGKTLLQKNSHITKIS
ncbi:hypothetical protein [Sporocytophaga myxococcoides]|uniref:hypothetical protein n=1 Tax=Sporocytophaga myxococcoides TaxID=153721 RepID=UPI0003F734D4|nr:hypothetical protein [Sporocytophaga myxococcoides]